MDEHHESKTFVWASCLDPEVTLRKLLRIDSVISVNLYQISFLSLVLNIYKKYFIYH